MSNDHGLTRRDAGRRLLAGSAAMALGLAGTGRAFADDNDPAPRPAPAEPTPPKGLDLLILGGTGFLGPAIVQAAIDRGHTMTLFNRGRTNTHLFPDLEKLKGDRDGKLDALKGRRWDAVIDTSGYVPRIVGMSAELLKDAVSQYVFISTISVYPGYGTDGTAITEETPVATMEDPTNEEVGRYYGALKALCEQAVDGHFPGRASHLRPGLIVGPTDPTDRFTYWPWRMAQGGAVLCPGDGATPFQVIDVRDLGAWTIHVIEQKVLGTYNAVGFRGPVTFRDALHGMKVALNTEAELLWMDEAFLAAEKVRPWRDLPLWVPGGKVPWVSTKRAFENGLVCRPVTETARDTVAWVDETERKRPRMGLKLDKEAAVVEAWRARQAALDAVEGGDE